jgi:hypothetical protein
VDWGQVFVVTDVAYSKAHDNREVERFLNAAHGLQWLTLYKITLISTKEHSNTLESQSLTI